MNKYIKKMLRVLSIRSSFCFHAYVNLKVGPFPLIECYCPKCGKVKYGNILYYDNSVYQQIYTGTDSIEFIQEKLTYLINRDSLLTEIKHTFELGILDCDESFLKENYETPETYEKIINDLLSLKK